MNVSPSKENILKKIRKALSSSTPIPFLQSEGNSSVFQPSRQELEVQFAEEFTNLKGKFVYCMNKEELAHQLSQLATSNQWEKLFCNETALRNNFSGTLGQWYTDDLKNCDASITSCECLVARTGTIVMSAGQESGRTVSVYAPIHICIAYTKQLVYDVKDGLLFMKDKYGNNLPSLITFATGPSRTADIEKTLVVGVHGPKEVYCFLVEGGND
ncbi:LutC/YkgG family protein [Pinibacter aurantiacus]|uniref:Lactate utilization protein n=1 Tax=Pinibacter aurantiacus TaxID=2851599 RepID=A0A9E2S914_9BACT|nr:lactate utilization protein [Pinibacter aurantiacus]MBV4357112.1 lactate utilization protein [Pinibacter aurantiacus]